MKINPKHKRAKKKHCFDRRSLSYLVKVWKHFSEGMDLLDKAILNDLLSQRKEKTKGR